MNTQTVIQQVEWEAARVTLLAIRVAVFVEEQGVPVELEQDQHDQRAIHLLASDRDGRPVGTARLLANGQIGRMAVLPAWRKLGIGRAMLRQLMELAAAQGLCSVFLHAQCQAEPFYSRLGFVAEGEVFEDAGIPHRCMRAPTRLDCR
jgi:predicted GNAT family N-acyltransferase